MKLLDHGGVTRKTGGIEPLHLAYQILNLSKCLRIALCELSKLIQLAESVSICALLPGIKARVVRSDSALPTAVEVIVPRVYVSPHRSFATSRASIPHIAADASLALTAATALTAQLPLPRLTVLTYLILRSTPTLLSRLIALAVAILLPLPALHSVLHLLPC
jgi:hypothetical protein